jgi:hypothetical protein
MRGQACVILDGETRNAYKVLVENPKGKRPLRRPRCKLEDNIKINFRERNDGVVWTGLTWRTVDDSCENGNEPLGCIDGRDILE